MIRAPSAELLLGVLRERGYVVFQAGPYDLNVVVLRAIPGVADAFDDLLCVAYIDDVGAWRCEAWACTADPGRPGLLAPRRADGVAVVAAGQHRAAWCLGEHHRGRPDAYEALVPCRPIPVYRDANRDAVVDYGPATSTSSATNIHRASAHHRSTVVGPWSEGCVVVADPQDFARFLDLCRAQRDHGHGDRFTVTLLEVRDPPGVLA